MVLGVVLTQLLTTLICDGGGINHTKTNLKCVDLFCAYVPHQIMISRSFVDSLYVWSFLEWKRFYNLVILDGQNGRGRSRRGGGLRLPPRASSGKTAATCHPLSVLVRRAKLFLQLVSGLGQLPDAVHRDNAHVCGCCGGYRHPQHSHHSLDLDEHLRWTCEPHVPLKSHFFGVGGNQPT